MNENPSNVLLVLLRLDLKARQPLLTRVGQQGETVQILQEGSHLLAGILDPTNRSRGAPVTDIELIGGKLKTYNKVLTGFQEISRRYYDDGGFIEKPESYNSDQQEEVLERISAVGHLIYDLFEDDDPQRKERRPIRDWLGKLLHSDPDNKDRPTQPVTIVTNDLNVPWFWLKRLKYGPSLCEVCPLGLLQLSAGSGEFETRRGAKRKNYNALLINGTTGLPFVAEELDTIGKSLGDSHKFAQLNFTAHGINAIDDITKLRRPPYRKEQLISDFRVVHFSGQYDRENMFIGDESLDWDDLLPILSGSLLVLDGASRSSSFESWTDVEALTSTFINERQVSGCVVSVLPVKDDPIVSKILWGTFYQQLRYGSSTIAQALFKARQALREHFETTASKNPSWLFYQLMGSAAVQLCDED